MKTLKLSKDSWHWKLTSLVWADWRLQKDDFCTYVRKFITTILVAIFLALLVIVGVSIICYAEAAFFGWLLLSIIHWEFQGIENSWLHMMPLGAFINTLLLMGLVVVSFAKGWWNLDWTYGWVFKISCDKIPMCPETRDFLSHAYESIHNKMCFKMEWKDK